jgi:hypothetical protein
LILIILLLAGGIIYATFASNPMSFDDLIELRFLPSRRRHRDPEYFEQLKSMMPREVSYRVAGDESGPQQNTFEIAGGQVLGSVMIPPVRALHAPMDTTTMIGATDDHSHRHKV